MIQPNEIRIYNWFNHNSEWSYRQSGSPDSMESHAFDFQWDEADWYALGESTLSLENISPIPISEEWLLKFGFSEWRLGEFGVFCFRNPICILQEYEGNFLCVAIGDPKTGMPAIPSIKYVHQLQNLYFAITGKELEIK